MRKLLYIKGSLTVEASLVLPIFIFGIVSIIYYLQIIGIQEHIQQGITQMGLDTSKYTYVYKYIMDYDKDTNGQLISEEDSTVDAESTWISMDNQSVDAESDNNQSVNNDSDTEEEKKSSIEALVATGIDSAYFKAMLPLYVQEERINNSCIKGGLSGIHTFMSSYMSQGDDVDIILSYTVRIPLPMIFVQEIPFLQRVRVRGFHGDTKDMEVSNDAEQEEDEEIVYITETGNVYHLSRECSHLKLTIKETDANQMDDLRNQSGGKYYPCSLCAHNSQVNVDSYYITSFGDKYHINVSCSGLKRTITTVSIDQVGDKTLCSRCKGK